MGNQADLGRLSVPGRGHGRVQPPHLRTELILEALNMAIYQRLLR